jgi:regulator of protease activity HflC (stomatin/prohibitin superfamily)
MIWIIISIVIALIFFVYKSCLVVPETTSFIIERLGKYNRTLHPGFNFLFPLIDRISDEHSLKEKAIEVAKQICITKDNISVEVDGILYFQVVDPEKATYGINDYLFATTQITQTTMRSVIGKLDLDQTFKERDNINSQIVEAADKASDPWGIKVNRYEIKDIKPPKTINDAMEKQMRAEREKRAVIAQSEGEQKARINRAEGEKQELIARAEGKAIEIKKISIATADGLEKIANSITIAGGKDAISLRIAEQFIKEFGNLAKTNNSMIIPADLTNLSSFIATATSIYKKHDLAEVIKNKIG